MKNRQTLLTGAALIAALGTTVSCSAQQPRPQQAAQSANANAQKPHSEPYQWKNVAIVGGGFVSGIIFHPTEPGLVYARTDIGGAYRWDTTTKHWIPLTDWASAHDWNLLGTESVGLDPSDANRVYIAAGMYTNDWAGNGSFLRSYDRGKTWKRTDFPFKLGGNEDGRSIGERIAVDPNRSGLLFFGSRHNGLWKSNDDGATFHQVESFPVKERTEGGVGIGFVLFDATSGAKNAPSPVLFAGVGDRKTSLYQSGDGGATWQGIPGQPTGFLPHHAVLTPNGETLFVSYGSGPGPNGMTDGAIWKYDTRAKTWTDVTPIKPGGGQNFGYAGLTLDAQHSDTLIVATMDWWSRGDTLFRTVDGGKTWVSLKEKSVRDSRLSPFLRWGKPEADLGHWIGDVEIDPFHSGHVLYVTGATIWNSDDVTAADKNEPTHWTVGASGLEETAVIDLLSPAVGAAHLVSGLGDIGGFWHDDLTVSPQAGMLQPALSNTDSLDYAQNAPEILVRSGRGGQAGKQGQISRDSGKTWAAFASEPTGSKGSGSVAISADGKTIVWAAREAIPSVSRDGGATWTPTNPPLPANVRVVSDRADARVFYAFQRETGTLYQSRDAGATFAPVAGASFPKGSRGLKAAPGKAGDLWLSGGENGLLHLQNGGETSVERVPGVTFANVVGFGAPAPGKTVPTVFLVGAVNEVSGVFRSSDMGKTWTRINDDAHQYGGIGGAITGDPRIYGRVYLGTNGRGVLYGDPKPMTAARRKP